MAFSSRGNRKNFGNVTRIWSTPGRPHVFRWYHDRGWLSAMPFVASRYRPTSVYPARNSWNTKVSDPQPVPHHDLGGMAMFHLTGPGDVESSLATAGPRYKSRNCVTIQAQGETRLLNGTFEFAWHAKSPLTHELRFVLDLWLQDGPQRRVRDRLHDEVAPSPIRFTMDGDRNWTSQSVRIA